MSQDLARRAVACCHWRWMPGMLVTRDGAQSVRIHGVRPPRLIREGQEVAALPDLTDPATVGCLLALVREAWADPFALIDYDRGNWGLFTRKHDCVWVCTAETEAAALVAALEAAP